MSGPIRRASGTIAAAALAIAGVGLGVLAPSAVETGAVDAPRAAISLVSQTAWTELGETLTLGLRLDGDVDGLTVQLTSHRAIESRVDFEQTIGGDRLRATLATVEQAAIALPVGPDGRVLQVPLTSGDGVAPSLSINREGVYPLEVALVDSAGNAVDEFVTHVVAVPPTEPGASAIGSPLRVAWIWPVTATPAYQPNGAVDSEVVEELGPAGRVGEITGALADADAAAIPLTLVPGPETVQSWASIETTEADIGSGLAALRSAAQSNQTLRSPYITLDPESLDRAGLGATIAPEYAAGTDALNETLEIRVDPRTAIARPVGPATLDRLWELNTDRVIVEPEALVPTSSKFTPAAPATLASEGHVFSAAVADAQLAEVLTGDAPVALRAQWFLSTLAVIAGELPNATRGVVVLPEESWAPPQELLAIVLEGLADNPLVVAVDIETFFNTVPLADDGVRELTPPQIPPPPAVSPARFREAEDRLVALRNLVGRDDPRVLAGERSLLVSLSSVWRGAAGVRQANAELATIGDSLSGLVSGVAVPERRTLTLTAREAEIPVSIQNNTGRPIRVEVTLTSDKLLFPNGSSQILDLPPRNTTARFAVEARASGTFPLLVEVTSTDGRVTFSRSQITIRSAVVSNVGIFLTVGAILFLAIWWFRHERRRRRVETAAAIVDAGPSSDE